MEDTLTCPICGNKLRTIKLNCKYLHDIGKTSDYLERTCSEGRNHSLQFFMDQVTNQVDLLKLSLNPKYSRYLEIDFYNKKCRINCLKNSVPSYIDIPKMLFPDFPDLIKLKERISLYVTFS